MNRIIGPAISGLTLITAVPVALAQTATPDAPKASFQVFGVANVQYESVRTSDSVDPGADKPTRNRFSNVSSDLGFRGSLPVSSAITARFQYVTGINLDNAANGLFGGAKDAFVGLSFTDVGTLKLGRLTGAARWNAGTADFSPAGAGPQDDQAALSLASGQTGIAPQFSVRLDNTVGFESVAWNGLSVRAYYSANEGRSNSKVASGALLDDDAYSLGAQYVWEDLDVRVSYEVRNDKGVLNNSTTNNTRDKNYRLGIRYKLLPSTQIALGADHSSFSDSTATGTAKSGLYRRGLVLGARHQMGQHVIYGGYGKAGNVKCSLAKGATCNGADTGARQFVISYNQILSKELLWEAFYSQVSNDKRARYDFDSGGISPAVGAKASAFGVGLRYAF